MLGIESLLANETAHLNLNDYSLSNCVQDDLGRAVQVELLHEIGSVGLDRG